MSTTGQDHLATIAKCLERIAAHLEEQAAHGKRLMEKHEAFDRNRKRLLQLLDKDKRFGGLLDRAMNCPDVGMEVIGALVEREDPIAVLNEIVMKPGLARKLSWMDEAGLATEMQCIEQRLALVSVAR